MDYNRAALFVRVVKAGSFTAAAAQLGLPKSSVSRGVAHLEEDLGVRLLQRTSRKLALTEAGQAFYDTAQGSVAALDEADEAARDRNPSPRGVVRIAAAPDLAVHAGVFTELVRRHPGIRVELSLSSRHVDLIAEGFDLAIRAGQLEDSSLVARRVGTTILGVVGAPGYLKARGRPARVADLASHDWVLYRASAGRARHELTGPGGEKQTFEVTGQLVADDIVFCRTAVESGAGLALLPLLSVGEAVRAGKLEVLLRGWSHDAASVYLVMPSARHVPARVRLVGDFLFDYLGRQLSGFIAQCEEHRVPRPLRAARATP